MYYKAGMLGGVHTTEMHGSTIKPLAAVSNKTTAAKTPPYVTNRGPIRYIPPKHFRGATNLRTKSHINITCHLRNTTNAWHYINAITWRLPIGWPQTHFLKLSPGKRWQKPGGKQTTIVLRVIISLAHNALANVLKSLLLCPPPPPPLKRAMSSPYLNTRPVFLFCLSFLR